MHPSYVLSMLQHFFLLMHVADSLVMVDEDATVYVKRDIYTVPLHLLRTHQGRFLCSDLDFFDTVLVILNRSNIEKKLLYSFVKFPTYSVIIGMQVWVGFLMPALDLRLD